MANAPALGISIVVPSYNHAEYLPRTLDSILGQEHAPFEVIVADGASNDATVDILKQYAQRFPQLQWLSEQDKGPADAVNKGLKRVTGDIIGIQSSDDVYYPGAFAEVARVFAENPDVGFVCGDVEGIDEHDCVLYRTQVPALSWQAVFARSMAIPQSSIFFRRELAGQIGGWNGSFYGCDLDYWMRLLFRTRAMHLPRALSGWRRYEGQRTRPDQYRRIWDDYWRMIDTSPDVAAAPASVRRLAQASKHLLVLRCPPSQSRWTIWKHLLIGACLHPGFWRYNPAGMIAAQLPGVAAIRWVYRHLCRRPLRSQPLRQAILPKPERYPS
ncbi:MAG: glycosyltransferase family 2 protein [Stenotrophobium sp.]